MFIRTKEKYNLTVSNDTKIEIFYLKLKENYRSPFNVDFMEYQSSVAAGVSVD